MGTAANKTNSPLCYLAAVLEFLIMPSLTDAHGLEVLIIIRNIIFHDNCENPATNENHVMWFNAKVQLPKGPVGSI